MKTLLVVALLIHVTIYSGICQVIVVSPNTTGQYYNYNDITTGRSGQVYVESNQRKKPSWLNDQPSRFVHDLSSGKSRFEFDMGDDVTFTAPIQDDEDEDD